MNNIELDTPRLILNNLKYSDVEDIVACCSNKKVYKTLLNVPHPYTEEDGREFVRKSRKWFKLHVRIFQFAIRHKFEYNKFIGTISLDFSFAKRSGVIAYWLDPRYWNRGIMTEAARAVASFAFEVLKLHKLVISAYTTNPASCRIAQKLGFDFEGCQKEMYFYDGSYKDCNNYGLINPNHK